MKPALAAALALLAASLAMPVRSAEPPPALIEATETASAVCIALKGTPRILDGFEQARDLNGDGADDFVTDLSRLECAGAWSAFCGPSGCPVTAWLSRKDGGFDRFDLGRLAGFEIADGAPLPTVVARYAPAYCGDSVEDCTRTWRFDTNAPEEPAIDAPPAAETPAPAPEPVAAAAPEPAAAPREALPPGWTLRHVPGSSPIALGSGIGEIATLAGFCLSGQPFLAVTFHERPAGNAVRLGFAFSQGKVEVEAAYEETAGGAFVVPLVNSSLAARLAGRDSAVAITADGRAEGKLSLAGSTKALRGALADCGGF